MQKKSINYISTKKKERIKMTNFEKYKDDLMKIKGEFAVNKHTREILKCDSHISCTDCIFYEGNCTTSNQIKWLYEEYKKPILSDDEIELIKAFGKVTGKEWKFIGKKFGEVILFTDEPLIQSTVFGVYFKKEKGAFLHMSGSHLFPNLTYDADGCVLYDVKNKDCHRYK